MTKPQLLIDGSRALDEQLELWRYIQTDAGMQWLRTLHLDRTDNISFLESLISMLKYGETFYVTADISDFLAASTPNMPAMTLREDLLPAHRGFVLFENALPMPTMIEGEVIIDEVHGRIWQEPDWNDDIAAIGWRGVEDTSESAAERGYYKGIAVACFARPRGPHTQLKPVMIYVWHFGADQERLTESQSVAEAHNQGLDVEPDAERAKWHPIRRLRANYLMGLLAFINQRIMVAGAPRTAARGTRKRIESVPKWAHEPLVRVIEYRRREIRPRSELVVVGERREYTCRWIVGAGTGGFWNHYMTRNGYEARWILPFEKGPPGMPLRPPRATINVVRR